MKRSPGHPIRRAALTALALVATAAALSGCGTPATVKAVTTPLPGFQHDIQAAQNAVAQSAQQAQMYDSAGATGSTVP